jgi:N-acetylglucosaminyldiphosphoundecaprenol N-acetyl-beta-D-mannosaminyltransferase
MTRYSNVSKLTAEYCAGSCHRILGVEFFSGDAKAAVRRMMNGGLLVVPAAPALIALPKNAQYRDALVGADLIIADSAFMVLAWNLLQRNSLRRLSGLEYLREFLRQPEVRQPGNTFWVMASPASASRNLAWLRVHGIPVDSNHTYIAPIYKEEVTDRILLERLRELHPPHIIVTVGGGTQEALGLYLKRNLDHHPGIHCIGAAIAFLSGDQVRIPVWADKLYLGWAFRCLSNPVRHIPRYWRARKLISLLLRYRSRLPADAA